GYAAAGAGDVHDEIALEESPFSADRATEPQAPPDDGPPVSLGHAGGMPRSAAPGENGRRARVHASSMAKAEAKVECLTSKLPDVRARVGDAAPGTRRRSLRRGAAESPSSARGGDRCG